jgi:hypothetical protein
MSEQPTALRLADALANYTGVTLAQMDQAAAELRRLHAENELLGRACDKIRLMHRDEIRPLLNVHTVNSELLEALTHVSDWFTAAGIDVPAVRHARAAIARAEGGGMTPEEAIRWARQAGYTGFNDPWLHAFAALVAAAEREACAKVAKETVCDIHLGTGIKIYGTKAAAAIRARGNT